MSLIPDRRQFLQASAATGIGYWMTGALSAAESKSPNDQIQLGCIGVGGKGQSDVKNMSKHGKIFALCDVDSTDPRRHGEGLQDRAQLHRLSRDARQAGRPHRRRDDQRARSQPRGDGGEGDEDGQARPLPEAAHALDLGSPPARRDRPRDGRRHADGQPGHARQLDAQGGLPNSRTARWAREGSSHLDESSDLAAGRTSAADQAGAGRRSIGKSGWAPRSGGTVGRQVYHPFAWRGWWDFGTGALGDMACHTCNMPFMALNMRDPISVEAECPEHDGDTYPRTRRSSSSSPSSTAAPRSRCIGTTAATCRRTNCSRRDDDARKRATATRQKDEPPPPRGCLVIGDKATMYAAGRLRREAERRSSATKEIDVDFPRSPGHEKEWFVAMRDSKKPAMSNFPDYAGPAHRDDPARQPGRVQARPRRMGPGEPEAAQRPVARADRALQLPRWVCGVKRTRSEARGQGGWGRPIEPWSEPSR